jgi:beta-phosphoglucomutase-like phosphatase (HAD superfamily)
MAKIRGMGEGRFQLTGEGRGQLMLPPGVADQAAQQQAQAAANEERLARIAADTEQARQARLQQQEANRPMNRARAALMSLSETPVGQIGARVARTAFQRLPVVGYGAASASMGRNVAEIDEALQKQEYIDALIAASQLAATGASMYPPLAPIAVPAAFGLEAVKQARDYYR